MERRTFIAAGTATLLTACTGSGKGNGSTSTAGSTATAQTTTRNQTATPRRTPRPADWTALARDLDGPLIRPGDATWPTAHRLYNTRFDPLKPSAVAYVRHPDDIRTALTFARRHTTPLTIRNGGHSYTGASSADNALIIDVSELSTIRTTPTTATIGAGAKLIDVYRTLAAKGTTIPAGSCPTVGISGLTLGGGHGVTSRAYGLTCDNLTAATLVTADGKQLTATPTDHQDLFWALRGAGTGTFGVVTELHFRTHPAPESVTAHLTWPWQQAPAVLDAWQHWALAQPDEIWSSLHLGAAPGRTPTVSLTAFSLGSHTGLQNAVDRLADRIGTPATTASLRRRPYLDAMELYAGCSSHAEDAQCHLPGTTAGRHPRGALRRETYAARSDFFDRALGRDAIRTLLAQLPAVRGGSAAIQLTALGGAVNRVSPTATAFVHRRSRLLAQYLASWSENAPGSAAQSWLASAHKAMRPYASGAAYQNYADASLKNWRQAYYGSAVPRLTQVKRRYDPHRLFTHSQAL
ncbi:FAD-binding oxidoreductase [Streptomyces thermospinosisporus]|uniref:FAD-binding oxidoreductase n=1 Tax=Streptomyces thermospinosisporus TaxID=161482 RepID=A0ABP4JEA0_9ACTN